MNTWHHIHCLIVQSKYDENEAYWRTTVCRLRAQCVWDRWALEMFTWNHNSFSTCSIKVLKENLTSFKTIIFYEQCLSLFVRISRMKLHSILKDKTQYWHLFIRSFYYTRHLWGLLFCFKPCRRFESILVFHCKDTQAVELQVPVALAACRDNAECFKRSWTFLFTEYVQSPTVWLEAV